MKCRKSQLPKNGTADFIKQIHKHLNMIKIFNKNKIQMKYKLYEFLYKNIV